MNKKIIRLTESDLHRVVKESVQAILPKNLYSVFQVIDKSLSQIDNDTYVSRFYSDENQITIAVSRSVNRIGRQKIIEIMKDYGYRFYTSGANGEYIMMTFKPIIVTESNGKGENNWGNKGLPYGFQDDGHGRRIHVSHKGKIDGWNNGEYGWGRIESPREVKKHKRETDGWKDQYVGERGYIQSKGSGKNKQFRSIPRSMKESINNLADNPQYERFIESLYDLVGQYYDELGEEIIVDNLKHVAQWVEEGGLDK